MMGNSRSALVVAAVACLPFALIGCAGDAPGAGGSVAEDASTADAVSSGSARDPIVGTYRMVGRHIKDESGAWVPQPDFNSLGYITYSDTGYMGVHVMPLDREPFVDGSPTPEEAQSALRGYSAYYGPYTIDADEEGEFLIHHRIGQINPGAEVDAKRFYDLDGDQLILTPAAVGGTKGDATRQVVWERLPDVTLSDEAQRFVGFRQLLYTDRYVERDGEVVERGDRNEGRAGSYIIYTPTGHMMVHLMAREGRTPYAGATPSPEEALATYRSYGGYFGRFSVHEDEDPRYVVHHIEGRPRPADRSDAVRLYEIDGDVLRLGARPRTADGETRGAHLYWEMLPPRPE